MLKGGYRGNDIMISLAPRLIGSIGQDCTCHDSMTFGSTPRSGLMKEIKVLCPKMRSLKLVCTTENKNDASLLYALEAWMEVDTFMKLKRCILHKKM